MRPALHLQGWRCSHCHQGQSQALPHLQHLKLCQAAALLCRAGLMGLGNQLLSAL
jgi:hypothetical protein